MQNELIAAMAAKTESSSTHKSPMQPRHTPQPQQPTTPSSASNHRTIPLDHSRFPSKSPAPVHAPGPGQTTPKKWTASLGRGQNDVLYSSSSPSLLNLPPPPLPMTAGMENDTPRRTIRKVTIDRDMAALQSE